MSYDIRRSLGYWCTRISAALRTRLDERLRKHGLTCTAAIVLVALERHGPTTLVELAHWLEHAHPSVLRQIDGLEDAGYVERVPHERDRRMKLVCLTAKGERVLPGIHRSIRATQREAMAAIDARDSARLFGHFEKIAANLGLADWAGQRDETCRRTGRKRSAPNKTGTGS